MTQAKLIAEPLEMNKRKYAKLGNTTRYAYQKIGDDPPAWKLYLSRVGFPSDIAIYRNCNHAFGNLCDCGHGYCIVCHSAIDGAGWGGRCAAHSNSPALPDPAPPSMSHGGGPAAAPVAKPAPAAGGGPIAAPVVNPPAAPVVNPPAAPVVNQPAPAASGGGAAPPSVVRSAPAPAAKKQKKSPAGRGGAPPPTTGNGAQMVFISSSPAPASQATVAKTAKQPPAKVGGGGGKGPAKAQPIICRDCFKEIPIGQTECSCSGTFVDMTNDSQSPVHVKAEPVDREKHKKILMSKWVDPNPAVFKITGRDERHRIIELPEGHPVREEVVNEIRRLIDAGNTKLLKKASGRDRLDAEGNSAVNYIMGFLKDGYGGEIDVIKVCQVQKPSDIDGANSYARHLEEQYGAAKQIRAYHGTSVEDALKIINNIGLSFDRSKTINEVYGIGVYFGQWPQIAESHALKHPGNKDGIGCLIVSTIFFNEVADTRNGKRRPDHCDCGGSGVGNNQWVITPTRDHQAIPEFLAYFKVRGDLK